MAESTTIGVKKCKASVRYPATGLVAILETWTLRFLRAIRIGRQCRCQDECCSGEEQRVGDVI